MAEDQWHWQEPGTAWRGVGIYHITLTVPSRQPLLGTLVIPQNDPSQARVERTALGNAVVDELYVMCKHYPDIRIFQFCLMPDHLHAVIRVTRIMDTSIRSDYWSWDPKETWAAITWLAYLIYIHYRQIPRHRERLALWMLIGSFVLLQMCWWGINYLPSAQGSSVHTYSTSE